MAVTKLDNKAVLSISVIRPRLSNPPFLRPRSSGTPYVSWMFDHIVQPTQAVRCVYDVTDLCWVISEHPVRLLAPAHLLGIRDRNYLFSELG